ncbi:phosphoenolpyruvate carboxykinase (GTP) [candidate division KSB3 bacterium]|uniref:Phosphoenolpyruvate carboxykinase [GTP] n=1 Tax=candidate division KSB3 bacterium TaxID=2044937 RepID=A0A2G6E752_9BACT|nr:MAG: phosphoenolpyruvate carboxykinase (GTP) [candidate division KSB3 bacterium]PIE30301.1 MAG: phosphoenolpyruvate carboxykinase (GTP) [candidate division KSB3 bacterium]
MLELKKGIDILSEVGGVKTLDEANAVFAERLDQESRDKLSKIKTEEALLKIANAIAMVQADEVFVNTGSQADLQRIREMSIEKGEEKALAMPNHTIHFDLPQDQARLIDKTFYIVNEDEDISSLAQKQLRSEALEHIKTYMPGIGKGKTLMIGFYSRGPVGAAAALPAIEISTSTYVLHSGNILYRSVFEDFDAEVARAGYVITNVHSEGPNRPEDIEHARIYMDRSWLTTFSMFCTYAGNTLLLKKGNHRFAVDLATYYGKEKELSEHMFLTGLTGPNGRKTFFAGAAPSGCGKTTTAMVGSDFIGDDLAQLWISEDGTLRGINPEKGIFGIVEDVNLEGDPFLMKCLREEGTEVIWSNVLIDEHNVPHWVGNGEEAPKKGINFQGEWFEGKSDANGKSIPMSHPNSRCTLENTAIDNYNEEAAEDPKGVEVRVITYSGRDSDTMPPVWVAKTPDAGVVIGASIVSAATATEVGATGVRRQPWANAPFIPGALGDYMDAQFTLFNSDKLKRKPIMAGLNYFLTEGARGGEGKKLLGEKRDVKVWLGWLELYANGDVEAIETPIGFIPKYDDLNKLFAGIRKEYPKALYDKQFSFYLDNIIARIELQEEAYGKGERIPAKLFEIYNAQKAALLAMKERYGSIVSVEKLIEAAS